MKRIYTIGRDPQCDILIQDVRGVVSRVHAVLRVESNGKMYIKDQSMNGTYINGMRVTANVEIPVSRKDVINFANVMDLDWTIIPNPAKKRMEIIGFSLLGVVVAGLMAWLIWDKDVFKKEPTVIYQKDTIVNIDTLRDTVVIKAEPVKTEKPVKQKGQKVKADTVQVTGTEIAL